MIRPATRDDVPALAELENTCFDIDRLSIRSFRHLLTRGNATMLVEDEHGRILGYVLILYHRNTSMARMYSLAVDPSARGRGIARRLVECAEVEALDKGVASMRLEVRQDNVAGRQLYASLGYREFAVFPDYYEDHMDAQRMEKSLAPHLKPSETPVPFYPQSLEFTCGSACLMMAMKSLDPTLKLDRTLELRLWRESTTIFMTSGHGGCGPYGLALSARRRGFEVDMHVHGDTSMFVKSVRNEEKRQVIRIVTEDFRRETQSSGIRINHRTMTIETMEKAFRRGAIPVVLISAYRLTGDKAPHWVVVVGFDNRFAYIHEPYVDTREGQTETTCLGIPIPRMEFDRMMRYGKGRFFATILIHRKKK